MSTSRPSSSAVDTVVRALRDEFGDDSVSLATDVREAHGRDEFYHPAAPPDGVFFAHTTDQVAAAVSLCNEHEVPVIAFGKGTSVEGHVAALHGGLSIDLNGMNRILRVSGDDLDCTVEAGVTRRQLNDRLRPEHMLFTVDPGADASIGGMAATAASGTNTVRYGTMRQNVLGLTVVLADGQVTRTGGRARKSSAGYDLTRLFVGSEGTLGIITEVTLRLYGVPEAMSSAVCSFPSVAAAVRTAIDVSQAGIPVARMELLDERLLDACNRYSGMDHTVAPTLFFEFHGSATGVKEQAEAAAKVALEHDGSQFAWTTDDEERRHLWRARHDALYAVLALRPGAKAWPTDVCVPISQLAECIMDTKADLDASPLIATILGHVGDGNYHVILLIDPDDPGEIAEAERLNQRMVQRGLSTGGTCTGEHGVGYGKLDLLTDEHSDCLPAMRAIKQALDPVGILNPGKVLR